MTGRSWGDGLSRGTSTTPSLQDRTVYRVAGIVGNSQVSGESGNCELWHGLRQGLERGWVLGKGCHSAWTQVGNMDAPGDRAARNTTAPVLRVGVRAHYGLCTGRGLVHRQTTAHTHTVVDTKRAFHCRHTSLTGSSFACRQGALLPQGIAAAANACPCSP